MNKVKELQLQVEDRERALRAIGQALTDTSVKAERRIDRALGVVEMYDCGPSKAAVAVKGEA